jgi:hypothetical protein
MVDVLVEPTYGRAVISPVLSLANDYSGDYIVPADTDAIAATAASIGGVDVTAGPHNAFAYDSGNSSGLTVRIDTGEAFVGGRYLVSDDVSATRVAVDGSTVPVHDVDLPASSTTTVSIGPDDRANSVATDQLIIGPGGEFPTGETPRLPLYDFTTDGSSVTSLIDRRRTGKAIDVASVTSESINDVYQLDPTVADFGAAVNALVAEMSVGDVLEIPPANYDTSTKALIDTEITITSLGGHSGAHASKPIVTKQADVPAIESTGGTNLRISGLDVETAISDTTPGFIFRGKTIGEHLGARDVGGHAFYLRQDELKHNLNYTHLENLNANFCDGDGVNISTAAGVTSNTNAMYVHLRNHNQNTGWGINFDRGDPGGNVFEIQHAADSSNVSNGAMRLGGTRAFGRVWYAGDGIDTGVQFDGPDNYAQLVHINTDGQDVIDNDGNNFWEYLSPNRSKATGGRFHSSFRNHSFAGQPVEAPGVIADSVTTNRIGESRYYAGNYASLSDAISAASAGATVVAPPGPIDQDFTTGKRFALEGSGSAVEGTAFDDRTLTFNRTVFLSNLFESSGTGELVINGQNSQLSNFSLDPNAQITVNADNISLVQITRGQVTFASGTSGGVTAACPGLSVTDNGSNPDA